MGVLKEYDFDRVCFDIPRVIDKEHRDELCLGIRYAVEEGLFPEGTEAILKLANKLASAPKALNSLVEAIEKYLSLKIEPELLDKATYYI